MATPDPIRTYRDPILSLWQSAVQDVITRRRAENAATAVAAHAVASGPSVATEEQLMAPASIIGEPLSKGQPLPETITSLPPAAVAETVGGLSTVKDCAEAAAKFLLAEMRDDKKSADIYRGILNDAPCNLAGWSECVTTYEAYKLFLQQPQYRPNQNIIVPIPNQVTIAIVGDWGTGQSAAINVLNQVATFKPTILIHLGDIYFAGLQSQANDNFLTICKNRLPNIPLYSLCGNHDMYSGGKGYYWLLDQIGQKSSYFSLQNDYWQFIAMDTGYNDRDPFTVNTNMTRLYNKNGWNEADWHLNLIKNRGNRRLALLSHHQLFSPFSSVGNNSDGKASSYNPFLLNTFHKVISQVDIWFWGHEHTLALYDPYLGLVRGRCVGASAIPVFTDEQSFVADNDLTLPAQEKGLPGWNAVADLGSTDGCYNNAFAIMTISKATAKVSYYQVPLGGAYKKIEFTDTI
jgi:hypothetical protein